jgi:hypothetical protein
MKSQDCAVARAFFYCPSLMFKSSAYDAEIADRIEAAEP